MQLFSCGKITIMRCLSVLKNTPTAYLLLHCKKLVNFTNKSRYILTFCAKERNSFDLSFLRDQSDSCSNLFSVLLNKFQLFVLHHLFT